MVRHAINRHFLQQQRRALSGKLRGSGRGHPLGSVLPGLIASGEAVVADARSGIRFYIENFNDKTHAVEH